MTRSTECTAALQLDPSLAAARNNLALAFAASGRMDLARAQFLDAGDRASGLYNTGIAYLASGDERNALAAFDAASRARPTFDISRERAELIRARLARAAVAGRAPRRLWTIGILWPLSLLRRTSFRFRLSPQSVEEAGIPLDLILQLALKSLHFSGELSGTELSHRLGLDFHVIQPALDLLKSPAADFHCRRRVRRRRVVPLSDYRYAAEHERLSSSRPAITWALRRFLWRSIRRTCTPTVPSAPRGATQQRVRQAFSHLVISDSVLDQLGPAINAGHSMFVYGPPGNGKTVISQAIHNLLDGDIAIPHALEIEGQIVRLFDPVNHEVVATEHDENSLTSLHAGDRRWVRCRRPMVMVGGELTLSSLELSYSPTTGFYRAPVQAVANGGVLVIDDFGRQQCSPRELLNRWIVPLESRVDFLTLQSGQKFELPFMTMIVFATNIRPAELVDEAFLRRIQYKIFAESPTVQDFKTHICDLLPRPRSHARNPASSSVCSTSYYRPRNIPLRGCHPRDLIKQALSLASYLGRPAHLTPDLLEAACNSYFVNDREVSPVYA